MDRSLEEELEAGGGEADRSGSRFAEELCKIEESDDDDDADQMMQAR